MNEYDRAILELFQRADSALGWYQIERQLSNLSLSERPNLVERLAALCIAGLVKEDAAETEPRRRYSLTAAGHLALSCPAGR